MPRLLLVPLLLVSALLLTAAGAAPAAADNREKSYGESHRSEDYRERVRPRKEARYQRVQRHKSTKRYRYYYPYTSYWGPFAGPPGLF